jgi:hypothetical protein
MYKEEQIDTFVEGLGTGNYEYLVERVCRQAVKQGEREKNNDGLVELVGSLPLAFAAILAPMARREEVLAMAVTSVRSAWAKLGKEFPDTASQFDHGAFVDVLQGYYNLALDANGESEMLAGLLFATAILIELANNPDNLAQELVKELGTLRTQVREELKK